MKSFSKRVASFAMAAAMVLSVAAVSPVDAEAATAKITKKSSITAGKTYTYNVKNVTKSQYIKVRMSSGVTVKYNNKTVKKDSTKIKGGKTIALKVKAADKVGNYKATLKAVIYNKKNNKKVKTLTTQSTVKCTTLKVTSVQTASTNGKYLVATFNKALDSLNPADITIRNLNTNELLGVEDVKLASNGKSATITLAGAEESNATGGIRNFFVAPNVDYSFTVAKNGATASTNFTVDAIAAYVTVLDYDVDTREITLSDPMDKNTNINVNNFAWKVKVPETVCADNFQSLLGRTLNVWYNKNDVATKVVKNEETVVEGAFEFISRDVTTPYFKDKVTGKQYFVSANIGNTSDVHNTLDIRHTASGYVTNINPNGTINPMTNYFADKDDIDYAKLVLYSNGKIRAMVDQAVYDDKLYVTKVDADKNMVYCGDNKSVNLKGFTIVDHDKLVSIKDIKVGDMIFVATGDKFAEIYTTTKDGKVEAAYDQEFKFDGTLYNNLEVQLLPDSGKAKAPANMSYKEASAFIAAGGAATVFLNRANKPVFIKGEQKYAAGNTTATVLATTSVKKYTLANKDYVQFNGFDGSGNGSYDVCLDNLTYVSNGGHKWVIDATAPAGDDTVNYKTQRFKFNTVSGNEAEITTNVLTTKLVPNNMAGKMIEVEKNASGTIIGLTIKEDIVPATQFVGGKTFVKAVGNQNYQITAGTPVYAWNGANASTAKKVNYSDYSAVTPVADTIVYVNSTVGPTYEVAYVLVKNETVAPANYVEAVVGTILKADKKASYIKVFSEGNSFEYSVFRDDKVKGDLNGVDAGDYVRLGIANDGKTVVEATLIGDRVDATGAPANMNLVYMPVATANRVNVNERTFNTLANGTIKLAKKCTIVARNKNYEYTSRYEAATLADLAALQTTDKIYIHYAQTGDGDHTGLVDAIVIEY